MRSRLLLTLLAILSRLVTVAPLTAETLNDWPEVVTEFTRGERLLRDGDYLEASRLFARLADAIRIQKISTSSCSTSRKPIYTLATTPPL